MNISWDLYQRVDHKWGRQLPNGSFDGMMSSMAKGDADIAAASPSLTLERAAAVSHIVSVTFGIVNIFFDYKHV